MFVFNILFFYHYFARYPRENGDMDRINPTKEKNLLYISTYTFEEDLTSGVTQMTLHILNAVTKTETVQEYLKQDNENREYDKSPR